MASVVTASISPHSILQHADGVVAASDGAPIAYRTTARLSTPRSLLVMMTGTLGKPEYFDLMADELSRDGIKSYAIQSRVAAGSASQYADDLERIVRLAAAEHPGTPISVAGSSLGAMIALDWRARFNTGGVGVLAMNPVFMERMLPWRDRLKIAAGLVSDRVAAMHVNTPMSLGVPLTYNPASLEFMPKNPASMTVPAGLFDDVAKMSGNIVLHARDARGPLMVALAGADKVAANGATRVISTLLRGDPKSLVTVAGAAHDLSQAADHPAFVRAVRDFVLRSARVIR